MRLAPHAVPRVRRARARARGLPRRDRTSCPTTGMRHLGRAFGTLAQRARARPRSCSATTCAPTPSGCSDRFGEGIAAAGHRRRGHRLLPDAHALLRADPPGIHAGAMITASHNPQGWSGMKLATEYVTTLGLGRHPAAEGDRRRRAARDAGAGAVRERGRARGVPRRPVVARPAGAAAQGRPRLRQRDGRRTSRSTPTARAGFDVVPLYCDPDPLFPNHFPNPSETANRLAVRDEGASRRGADLGLSFDGDGDRLGVEDERGPGRQRRPRAHAARAPGARAQARARASSST